MSVYFPSPQPLAGVSDAVQVAVGAERACFLRRNASGRLKGQAGRQAGRHATRALSYPSSS